MKEIRDKNGLTEEEFLQQYRPGDYKRPSVAADMVIFTVTEDEKENYIQCVTDSDCADKFL